MSIRDTKQAKRLIEAMAPEGEFLAFINEREAQMLRDAGGSGIMTIAGIPSFRTGFEGSPEMGGRGTTESYGFDQSDDGGSGFDDTADVNLGLTRGPTVVTGTDQEEDNARMMEALGIRPGVTFSGTDNILDRRGPPRNVGDVAVNFGIFQLAQKYPKVFAAVQAGKTVKNIYDLMKTPDVGPISLTKMEERELTTLQKGKDLGLNNAKQNERLEELEQKKAEEEKK
jgi:hypothetical protein